MLTKSIHCGSNGWENVGGSYDIFESVEPHGFAMIWNAGRWVVGMEFQKIYGYRLKSRIAARSLATGS